MLHTKIQSTKPITYGDIRHPKLCEEYVPKSRELFYKHVPKIPQNHCRVKKKMNFSISSLILHSFYRSPLFTISHTYQNQFFTYSKLTTKNFFSNFIYSNHKFGSINLYKSKISRYLDSVIRMENDLYSNQTFHQQFSSADPNLIIQNCQFENCSTNGDGSAIFSSTINQTVKIQYSTFIRCLSQSGNCGAIEIIGAKKVSILSSCFSYCSALLHYSVFLINATKVISVNETALQYNGARIHPSFPGTENDFQDIMQISNSRQNIYYTNSTHNMVYKGSAGISAIAPIYGEYHYLNLGRNSGGYAFERVELAEDQELISYINIYHHKSQFCGTIHIQIYAKLTYLMIINVTLDPFIYAESDSLIILENSIFDCSLNSIHVKLPRGYTNQFNPNKNCIFDYVMATIVPFNNSKVIQCFTPDKEDVPTFFDNIIRFFYFHPHYFGFLLLIILIALLVISCRRRKPMNEEDLLNSLENVKLEGLNEK